MAAICWVGSFQHNTAEVYRVLRETPHLSGGRQLGEAKQQR